MIGLSERVAAHNHVLLQCISSQRCIRRSRGQPLTQPEATRLPRPSSLPLMAGWLGGSRTFPRWRKQLRCTCMRKMQPFGGIVRVSRPKPVKWRPLSQPKLTALQARPPLPCMPWLSCRYTEPRHWNKCTRVVPTRGWCRSCVQRLTSSPRATKVMALSTLVVQERHLWLNLAEMKDVDKACFLDAPISQTWLFGDTFEGFAQNFSAVQSRQRLSSPSCPCGMLISHSRARLQSARRHGHPPAFSRAATPRAESTPRPARWASRRIAAPPVSQTDPKSSRSWRSGPEAGNPEILDFALYQETTRRASLFHFICFHLLIFISVPLLAQGLWADRAV